MESKSNTMKAELKPEDFRVSHVFHRKHGKGWTETEITPEIMGKIFSDNDPEYAINDFEPIELSEEWLLKGQFKKQETETDGQVWQNSKVVLKYRNGQFRLYISDTEDDWFYTTSIVIRYVHKLQNIFYELTGNELIFNHG